MLHSPDSMFCYLTEDNILFSNDASGRHYASKYLFNGLMNQNELFIASLKCILHLGATGMLHIARNQGSMAETSDIVITTRKLGIERWSIRFG